MVHISYPQAPVMEKVQVHVGEPLFPLLWLSALGLVPIFGPQDYWERPLLAFLDWPLCPLCLTQQPCRRGAGLLLAKDRRGSAVHLKHFRIHKATVELHAGMGEKPLPTPFYFRFLLDWVCSVCSFPKEFILFLIFLHGDCFPDGSDGKESACIAGDLGLIPGWGRSPGERNAYPLQYSCLGNTMDRGAWWATVHEGHKSWT